MSDFGTDWTTSNGTLTGRQYGYIMDKYILFINLFQQGACIWEEPIDWKEGQSKLYILYRHEQWQPFNKSFKRENIE